MVLQNFYLGALFGAHATCSVSMTLLNKTLAQDFDYPWTVLLIQNVGTVLLGYLYPLLCERGAKKSVDDRSREVLATHQKILGMKVPHQFKNKLWVTAQTAFFMGMLFMSLKALKFVSVPLYVVARNTVPAVTASAEFLLTNVRISFTQICGLALTVVGAIVYSLADMKSGSFEIIGLIYAFCLVIVVALASVLDKTVVRILGQEEGIKPVECNQIRVALSIPINCLLIYVLEINGYQNDAGPTVAPLMSAFRVMSFPVVLCLFFSTVFGFGMGTFNFYLQQAVNAATVQVANILYKLTTTIISRVTHPAPVTLYSWGGFVLSLLGIAMYTFSPKLKEKTHVSPNSTPSNRNEHGKP